MGAHRWLPYRLPAPEKDGQISVYSVPLWLVFRICAHSHAALRFFGFTQDLQGKIQCSFAVLPRAFHGPHSSTREEKGLQFLFQGLDPLRRETPADYFRNFRVRGWSQAEDGDLLPGVVQRHVFLGME